MGCGPSVKVVLDIFERASRIVMIDWGKKKPNKDRVGLVRFGDLRRIHVARACTETFVVFIWMNSLVHDFHFRRGQCGGSHIFDTVSVPFRMAHNGAA